MLRLLTLFWRKLPSPFRQQQAATDKPVSRAPRSGLYFEVRFFVIGALCLVFYFIAANIGSGWIYLISAALLSVLVIGILGPLLCVSCVQASLEACDYGISGRPLNVVAKLKPKVFPLLWLKLAYENKSRAQSQEITVERLKTQQAFNLLSPALARGVHPMGNIVVRSCFPLGVCWAVAKHADRMHRTITIYPNSVSVDGFFLYKLRPSLAGTGGSARGSRAARQSISTRGLREYVRGDSPRIVHWASSARAGRLLVREFEAEGLPRFNVVLDLTHWQDSQQFELAVTAAASLLSLGHKLGLDPYLMLLPSSAIKPLHLPPVPPGLQQQMEILARIQPVTAPEAESDPDATYSFDRTAVMICAHGQNRAAEGSSYIVEVSATDNLESGYRAQKTSTSDFAHKLSHLGSSASRHQPGAFKSQVASEEDITQL